jgi:hypothetical protein
LHQKPMAMMDARYATMMTRSIACKRGDYDIGWLVVRFSR